MKAPAWYKEKTLEEMIAKREKTGMPPRVNFYRRAGRPKLPFSEQDWYVVECAFEDGMTIVDTAKMLGVSRKRLMRRIRNRCPGMYETISNENIQYHLMRIRKGKRNWNSSAWFLERVRRNKFHIHSGEAEKDQTKTIKMRKVVRTVTEETTEDS